jgi:hypothetical protein
MHSYRYTWLWVAFTRSAFIVCHAQNLLGSCGSRHSTLAVSTTSGFRLVATKKWCGVYKQYSAKTNDTIYRSVFVEGAKTHRLAFLRSVAAVSSYTKRRIITRTYSMCVGVCVCVHMDVYMYEWPQPIKRRGYPDWGFSRFYSVPPGKCRERTLN